jgi:hypothetical protein
MDWRALSHSTGTGGGGDEHPVTIAANKDTLICFIMLSFPQNTGFDELDGNKCHSYGGYFRLNQCSQSRPGYPEPYVT